MDKAFILRRILAKYLEFFGRSDSKVRNEMTVATSRIANLTQREQRDARNIEIQIT